MKTDVILEVQSLIKSFPKVQAVRGVSFQVKRGTCFGLLGPNGAGKSTTIEMMEGILEPTSGKILYQSQPLDSAYKEVCGIQFQSTALPDFLTVREVIRLFGGLYRKTIPLADLVKQCALEDFLDRDTHQLSGGQRQRALLAVALVNDPEILFLDEPTTGLDPQARRNFWNLVDDIKKRGKTIILTTHYMDEAYTLCDEIAIMDRGVIIAQGSPAKLLHDNFEGALIEIPKADWKSTHSAIPASQVFDRGSHIEIQTTDMTQSLQCLLADQINLARVRIRSQTLDDLFLKLTGKEMPQ